MPWSSCAMAYAGCDGTVTERLALCSGLLPSMMGVAHVAIQFPLYEALKDKLAERHHRDANDLPAADLVRDQAAIGSSTLPCHLYSAQGG